MHCVVNYSDNGCDDVNWFRVAWNSVWMWALLVAEHTRFRGLVVDKLESFTFSFLCLTFIFRSYDYVTLCDDCLCDKTTGLILQHDLFCEFRMLRGWPTGMFGLCNCLMLNYSWVQILAAADNASVI